jgi:hypothetical protein
MTTGQRGVQAQLSLSVAAGIATGGKLYYPVSDFWGPLFFGGWCGLRRCAACVSSARRAHARSGRRDIRRTRFEVQMIYAATFMVGVHDARHCPPDVHAC